MKTIFYEHCVYESVNDLKPTKKKNSHATKDKGIILANPPILQFILETMHSQIYR